MTESTLMEGSSDTVIYRTCAVSAFPGPRRFRHRLLVAIYLKRFPLTGSWTNFVRDIDCDRIIWRLPARSSISATRCA
jgi:hypothetical protein